MGFQEPHWVLDEKVSEAKLWEQRARDAMRQAREQAGEVKRLEDALRRAVDSIPHSVGKTSEDAIRALAKDKGWGEVEMGEPLGPGSDPVYTWGFRFHAGGTSFKAAGWGVPGGVVLTWWK